MFKPENDGCREDVVPAEVADPADAFGLLRRSIPRRIGKDAGPKARILVCAPSNSALDEIVLRLITAGLVDQDGRSFTPNVVRALRRLPTLPHSSLRIYRSALVPQVSSLLEGGHHMGQPPVRLW